MRVHPLLWVVHTAIAGCGGVTDTGGTEPEVPELTRACGALAREVCDRREPCGSPGGSGQRFEDTAECRERWASTCHGWASVPDGQLSSSDVDACAADLARSSCGEISRIARSSPARLPRCLRIPGARAEGDRCTSDAQCASSFCKFESAGATCAVAPAEEGYEGDACGPDSACASSLRCDDGICSRADCPETGCFDFHASCGGIDDPARVCPAGTECVNQSDRGAGQCAPYASDGSTCADYEGPRCLFPARCFAGLCLVLESGG